MIQREKDKITYSFLLYIEGYGGSDVPGSGVSRDKRGGYSTRDDGPSSALADTLSS